jgi:hypothetical protein
MGCVARERRERHGNKEAATPMRRIGAVDEIAEAVSFLCSTHPTCSRAPRCR